MNFTVWKKSAVILSNFFTVFFLQPWDDEFVVCLMVGSPVMLLPEGSVPVNAKVVEIINIVKPQAIELIDYANNVRAEKF